MSFSERQEIKVVHQGVTLASGNLASLIGIANSIPVNNKSPLYDAFGRNRVSEPFTIFDSKQLYDSLPLFYDDAQTSGSGTTSTHSTARASTTISVSNATAGVRVRQTKRRFNYQPGKSQLILLTFVLGTGGAGITKRVGYFDENNGVFLEQEDGIHYFVIRSSVTGSPVDTRVAITDGNLNGAYATTLDFSKAQILLIDLEWLGVGSVRPGFVVDGVIHYIHSFNNANNLDSVYMSTPNLPVRYEINNDGTGGADSLEHICSTVISEGGVQQTGVTFSASRGTTVIATPAEGVFYPLMSGRLKTTHLSATIQPESIFVSVDNATTYEVGLFLNPAIAGVDAASWVNVANSAIQYDVSRDTTNIISNGTVLNKFQATATNQGRSLSGSSLTNLLTLGSQIDGTRDEMVIAVRRLTGGATSRNFLCAVNWSELV